jgi:antitoxin component of MazEF toxin-antitoxin module
MFKFGKRNVVKQGGSFMIALPMQWMKSWDSDVKSVVIEMDSENQLRIRASGTCHENTVY